MMKIAPVFYCVNYGSKILLLCCLSVDLYAYNSILTNGDLSHAVSSISMSSQYEYSNNIHQQRDTPISGYNQQTQLALGYKLSLQRTDINLGYQAYDYRYNDDSLDNEQYWIGQGSVNQRLFNNQVTATIGHTRQRYLLDENEADIPSNQAIRDVSTLSGLWTIPYSARAGFELNNTTTIANYPEAEEQDSNRNIAALTWFNHLNNKSQLRLASSYSNVEFPFYNQGYEKIESDIQLIGKLRKGRYELTLGHSYLTQDTNVTKGFTYQLSYNYKFNHQSITLFAQQQLTDSSIIAKSTTHENSQSLSNTAQVLWHDSIKLEHQYEFNNSGFNNSVSIYFNNESSAISVAEQDTNSHSQEFGITNQLTLPIGKKISTSLTASYQDSALQNGSNKQQWQSTVSSSYQLSTHMTLSFAAEYTNVSNHQQQNQYDEWRYSSKITLTY